MQKYRNVLFIILTLGCSTDKSMMVSGYITMKGSAPHTYVVIEDKVNHTEYKIENAKAFNLRYRQKEKLKMKVKLIKEAAGPGFPAVIKVVKMN